MQKSKWQEFVLSCKNVSDLRQKYDTISCNFMCVDTMYFPDAVDSNIEDVYDRVCFIGSDRIVHICDSYKPNQNCEKTDCKNCTWNKSYVELAAKLKAARQARRQAFCNLFVRAK